MGEIVETKRDSNYYQFAEDLTYEQWLEIGQNLMQATQNIMWWLGDWWNFGDRKYGELAAQALNMEIPYNTFSKASYVANKVPLERRNPELSWTHHSEVASLDAGLQKEYLDKAIDEGLSVKALRSIIKKQKVLETIIESDNVDLEDLGLNYKPTTFWSFGKKNELYGYDEENKTHPQLIGNLLYFYGGVPSETKLIDMSDKFQVTKDVATAMGFDCKSYDLDPIPSAKKVEKFDFINDRFPASMGEADLIIFNSLDAEYNMGRVDIENYLARTILSLSTSCSLNSKVAIITRNYPDFNLQDLFRLVENTMNFDLEQVITAKSKYLVTKDSELTAIQQKSLVDTTAYIIVLNKVHDN